MSAVIGAASWSVTMGVCAVLFSIIAGVSVGLLREIREFDARDREQRTPHPPLPMVFFGGIPVAVVMTIWFARVSHHDHQLHRNEIAVLCAATTAFALIIATDIIRAKRHRPSDRASLTL